MKAGIVPILAAALLLPPAGRAREDGEVERRFAWDRANLTLARADRPAEFLAAAQDYNELARAGVANGALFFNLGTALLLAGDAANAEAALVRAERYLGSTADVRTNLRQAAAARQGHPDASLPWTRTVFFWHYGLPGRTRLQLALSAWALFWIGLLVRRLGRTRGGRVPAAGGALAGLGLVFALVFGCSAAVTCLQEWHDARTWSERVFVAAEPPAPGRQP
jgi:hypothetical protein